MTILDNRGCSRLTETQPPLRHWRPRARDHRSSSTRVHLRRPFTVERDRVQSFEIEQDRPKSIAVEDVGFDAIEERFSADRSVYPVTIRIVCSAARIVSSRTLWS